jgi:putative intracellular protease/amidase
LAGRFVHRQDVERVHVVAVCGQVAQLDQAGALLTSRPATAQRKMLPIVR